MGDDNTIEKTVIKDNKDILNDLNNYAFDELPEMRATDKIIEKIVDITGLESVDDAVALHNLQAFRASNGVKACTYQS